MLSTVGVIATSDVSHTVDAIKNYSDPFTWTKEANVSFKRGIVR